MFGRASIFGDHFLELVEKRIGNIDSNCVHLAYLDLRKESLEQQPNFNQARQAIVFFQAFVGSFAQVPLEFFSSDQHIQL